MVYISNVFRILGFLRIYARSQVKRFGCNLLQVRRGFGVGVKGVRLPAHFDITLA